MRGMRNKKAEEGKLPKSQLLKKRCSLTWAILIKSVYEVDTMLCPACGGEMNIISIIDGKHQPSVVTKILKHCELWKDPIPRSPPEKEKPQIEDTEKSFYDHIMCSSKLCVVIYQSPLYLQ